MDKRKKLIECIGNTPTADSKYTIGQLYKTEFVESIADQILPNEEYIFGRVADLAPVTGRKAILEEAIQCVCQDRNAQYGEPEEGLAEVANLWSWWLRVNLSARDVAVMMALLKIARIATGSTKADSYIDACGYLAIAAELDTDTKREGEQP